MNVKIEEKKKITTCELKEEIFDNVMSSYWEDLCSGHLTCVVSMVVTPNNVEDWSPETPEYFDDSQRKEIETFKEDFGVVDFPMAVRWHGEAFSLSDLRVEAFRQKLFHEDMHKLYGGGEE